MQLKEKLINLLGSFGGILYLIVMIVSFLLPVVMIMISFDLPFWTQLIMIALLFIMPSLFSFIFWIIGLIGVIMGPQDIIAIIYYITFAIFCLPKIVFILSGFFTKE